MWAVDITPMWHFFITMGVPEELAHGLGWLMSWKQAPFCLRQTTNVSLLWDWTKNLLDCFSQNVFVWQSRWPHIHKVTCSMNVYRESSWSHLWRTSVYHCCKCIMIIFIFWYFHRLISMITFQLGKGFTTMCRRVFLIEWQCTPYYSVTLAVLKAERKRVM